MVSININENCLGISCSKCVDICLARVFDKNDEIIVKRPNRCYNCGHCLAICPKDAISHSEFSTEMPFVPETIETELMLDNFAARRSIRFFKPEKIDNGIIKKLIEAANSAPTAKNVRNIEIEVLEGEKVNLASQIVINCFKRRIKQSESKFIAFIANISIIKKKKYQRLKKSTRYLKGLVRQWSKGRDLIFYNAPLAFILHSPKSTFSEADANLAAAQITHVAHSLGLGTCYMGYFVEMSRTDKIINEKLEITNNNRVEVALAIGYPRTKFRRVIIRDDIKVNWQ